MKRIAKENINTPELFDHHFSGRFQYADIIRLEKLAKHFKGGYYLELGCFDSPLPNIIKERFPDSYVTALDFSPKVIETFKPKYPQINYIQASVPPIPFIETFDYIVAGEFIEHMEDPEEFIRECQRALTPGGWLALSTPLEESESNEMGGGQHIWSFTEQDFKNWGFETEIMGKTILAWKQK